MSTQCCLQVFRQSGGFLGHPGILSLCLLRHRPPCCPEDPLDIPGSSLCVPSYIGPHAVWRSPWTSRDPPFVSPQTQAPIGHNRPVDAVDCQVQAIRSQMRKRALEEITPVTAIYNEQLISLNTHPERNSIAPKLPSFMSLKSSLYHNRHSRLPPLPKMRDEIRVEGDWTKTLTGKNFLLRDDGDSNKILILGHKRTH